jgi:polyphosphate kinase 2
LVISGQRDRTADATLERLADQLGLSIRYKKNGKAALAGPDGDAVQTWREDYPYVSKLRRGQYEKTKRLLQIEMLKLQRSIRGQHGRLVILFEGRDAAGKGGTIKRFTENLNPRGAHVVALDRPTEREQTEWYLQRYISHLPAAGEIAMFDRSWYNRAGVERVMGFCRPDEVMEFLREAPEFERMLARDGITLVKFWFSVSRTEQLRRFVRRQLDPVKRWKLSPIDLASLDKWDEYTKAKESMFFYTDLADAPWTVVKSNDKKRARLEAMRYVLSRVPYEDRDEGVVSRPDPLIVGPAPLLHESGERGLGAAGPGPGYRPAHRQAGGAVDVIDHAHVGHRIIGRGDHGLAAQHRRGERAQLVGVGGLAADALPPGAAAGPGGEQAERLRGQVVQHSHLAVLAHGPGPDPQQLAGPQRGADPSGHAAAETERGHHGPVHLRRVQPGLGRDHGRLAGAEHPDAVDRVAPRVHGGAPGQVEPVPDVGEPGQREAQGGLHVPELTELAGHDLLHPAGQRVVAVVERLHHHPAGRPRGVGDLGRFGLVRGERLLAQHVLARGEGPQRPRGVQRVRQRVVDRVHVGIGDQGLVRLVHHGDAVLGGEPAGPGRVPGRDRGHQHLGHQAGRRDQRARGDPGSAERAHPQLVHDPILPDV